MKGAWDKLARPCFEAVVRVAVGSADADRWSTRLQASRVRALTAAFSAYSGDNALVARGLRRPGVAISRRQLRRGDLYSLLELAALAHLPIDRDVPGVARAGARTVAPPPATPRDGKVLGHAESSMRRPVALAPRDATQHMHLIGATGSGKSTLMVNLVCQDVAAHRGLLLIGLHGQTPRRAGRGRGLGGPGRPAVGVRRRRRSLATPGHQRRCPVRRQR